MDSKTEYGEPTFRQYEQTGWDRKAKTYHDLAGGITREAARFLLDAAQAGPGAQLLDVACGPGYGAGYASRRGVHAIGVDFAPGMVREARKNFPGTDYREGDAEALSFPDQSFDAVICSFGLMHFSAPERAISEALRVLKPGGRYVFTVWSGADRHDYFGLVLQAIQSHGTLDVPLPPAPPFFRFSEPAECERVLVAAGFETVAIEELALQWQPGSTADFLAFLEKSSVRMAMLLESQTPDALAKIRRSILESGQRFRRDTKYQLNWPAVMAVARKPA